MKNLLYFVALSLAATLAVAGCTSAQLATAQGDLAKLQAQVVNGCAVVQPVLQSVAALDPSIAAAATANGIFCAGAATVSVLTVQSAVTTGLPAINAALQASTAVPSDKKPLIAGALGVFQLLLTNALEIYGAPVATAPAIAPVPASSALVASTS